MSSLRVRLLLLVGVVLVPSFVLLVVFLSRERQMRVEAAQATAVQLVDIAVRQHQEAIEDGQRILTGISLLPQIRSGDSEACQRALLSIGRMVEEGWSITRTRADGVQDCATRDVGNLPRRVADTPRFLQLRELQSPTVGRFMRATGTDELLLPVNVPMISESGGFDGALSAGLRVRWFDKLVTTMSETPGAVLSITSATGEMFFRSPVAPADANTESMVSVAATMREQGKGVLEALGIDGVRRVWAFDQLPSSDTLPTFLAVGVPANVIYAGINAAMRNALLALVGWLLLVAAMAWWATDSFVLRDVRALLGLTERLGAGELGARTTEVARTRELGRLARSFNQMAQRLEDRQSRDVQAQKLESIGQLAGGVAHDFNNLLTAIIGNTELARDSLEPRHPARPELDAALDAADRSAALTRQLLAFARRTEISPRVVRVDGMLHDITALLKRLIGEHISLTVEADSNVRLARLDTASLEQALVNLVVNARDSMPTGGQIVLTARNVTVRADDIDHSHGVPAGQWIVITVRDTGSGMSADVLDRAFEPFFTTKPVGKGTGLGLAMVYGTLAQHAGHIWVESAPGHGTAVRLFLPPEPEGSRVDAEDVESPPPALLPGRTVLLVEDEQAVRAVVARVLTGHGFTVLASSNGADAIERCDDGTLSQLALVVTDVVMPRMGGPELVAALRERRHDLPVLFVSGYRETNALDDLLETPNTGFLAKPFTPTSLLHAVQQQLEMRTP
jgi:signal transduction histidine kinase/CheY-like chemotaxis protein